MSTADAVRALSTLPGIGPWTATYVLWRGLGDHDPFLATDLGVRRACNALGIANADIERVATAWRPWRGYVTLYLWESLHQ